jgi:hypothetical protein
MAHQRDVGLVVHDRGEQVIRVNGHGEPLRLAQRTRGLIVPA